MTTLSKILFSITFVLFAFVAFGQNPFEVVETVTKSKDLSELLSYDTLIMATLMNIAGFFAPKFPVLNTIPSSTWRFVVLAILLIAAAALFGFDFDLVKGLMSYFVATTMYQTTLKPAAKAMNKA